MRRRYYREGMTVSALLADMPNAYHSSSFEQQQQYTSNMNLDEFAEVRTFLSFLFFVGLALSRAHRIYYYIIYFRTFHPVIHTKCNFSTLALAQWQRTQRRLSAVIERNLSS